MEVLWATSKPQTVRDVLDALNTGRRPPLAYTTVMTVLVRLADKAIVFPDTNPREIAVQVTALDANTKGALRLSVSGGWKITPAVHEFSLGAAEQQTLKFDRTAC